MKATNCLWDVWNTYTRSKSIPVNLISGKLNLFHGIADMVLFCTYLRVAFTHVSCVKAISLWWQLWPHSGPHYPPEWIFLFTGKDNRAERNNFLKQIDQRPCFISKFKFVYPKFLTKDFKQHAKTWYFRLNRSPFTSSHSKTEERSSAVWKQNWRHIILLWLDIAQFPLL